MTLKIAFLTTTWYVLVLARAAYQRQDGNLPKARELFSVVLGLFFHFDFLSKVEVAMAFDTSGLTPSVDDSHVVSSEKLTVVNFSGNLGCDFQSNTTEDSFLKVSERFERRDFDSQTSDITGRRFDVCSKDLNHGCFDSEDDVHFKGDLLSSRSDDNPRGPFCKDLCEGMNDVQATSLFLENSALRFGGTSFPKEEVEFSKGFCGEGNNSGSFEVVFGSKNRVFEDLGRFDFGSEVEFSSMRTESSILEKDGICLDLDRVTVKKGDKDDLFEDGSSSVVAVGVTGIDCEVSNFSSQNFRKIADPEDVFRRKFKDFSTAEEMEILHADNWCKRKRSGMDDTYLAKKIKEGIINRCEQHRIQQLMNDPDVSFLISSLQCQECAQVEVIQQQLKALLEIERKRSKSVKEIRDLKLFNLQYNRPSAFGDRVSKFHMDINNDELNKCGTSQDVLNFPELCQAFAPAIWDRVFHGFSDRFENVEFPNSDFAKLYGAVKPVEMNFGAGSNIGFAALFLTSDDKAFFSSLDFINDVCKGEFGDDVFLQDDPHISKGHVITVRELQEWTQHLSGKFAMNLRWLDFIDRDELFFIPCAFLSPEVVWTFLKLLSIHGEIDDELQYDRQCEVHFSIIQHIRGSVFSLAVSDSELNEIREKYSFSL